MAINPRPVHHPVAAALGRELVGEVELEVHVDHEADVDEAVEDEKEVDLFGRLQEDHLREQQKKRCER